MQQVSANIYVETRFRGCNPGFVVTKEGVVMIDTPQRPSDAVAWREETGKRGQVRYLINTEPHSDHFTGNYFFSGIVIAHQGVRERMLTASREQLLENITQIDPQGIHYLKRYQFRVPTITFSHHLSLYLGDHTFELIHLPGHTAAEIAVYIPQERVVFTGDNVSYKVQPFFHVANPEQWLQSLERIKEMEVDVIVPGHGEVCSKTYLDEQASFIREWVEAVKRAISQGLSKEQAMDRISFLDRYPMPIGLDAMGPELQRWNVARLYDLLTGRVT